MTQVSPDFFAMRSLVIMRPDLVTSNVGGADYFIN
jgi:hypothetical protein